MASDARRRHSLVRLLALLVLAMPGSTVPSFAAEELPLAIQGYDTVAYFSLLPTDKPVPGKPEHEYAWDEQRYRFANERNLAAFRKEPGRYLPRYGNLCASALAYGLDFPADANNWTVHEGRLYLFGSPGGREDFQRDPETMRSAAERNVARLRQGQQPIPQMPLTGRAMADMRGHLKLCDAQPATPSCTPQIRAKIQSVIDNQPSGTRSARPR